MEVEELLYQDRPIQTLLITSQNSPQPIKTMCLFTDRPTTPLHTATTSQHASSGDQPIQEQRGLQGAEGRSLPIGTVCLRGGLLPSVRVSLGTAESRSLCLCIVPTARLATLLTALMLKHQLKSMKMT